MSEFLSIFATEKFQEAFKAPGMMIEIIRNERNTQRSKGAKKIKEHELGRFFNTN